MLVFWPNLAHFSKISIFFSTPCLIYPTFTTFRNFFSNILAHFLRNNHFTNLHSFSQDVELFLVLITNTPSGIWHLKSRCWTSFRQLSAKTFIIFLLSSYFRAIFLTFLYLYFFCPLNFLFLGRLPCFHQNYRWIDWENLVHWVAVIPACFQFEQLTGFQICHFFWAFFLWIGFAGFGGCVLFLAATPRTQAPETFPPALAFVLRHGFGDDCGLVDFGGGFCEGGLGGAGDGWWWGLKLSNLFPATGSRFLISWFFERLGFSLGGVSRILGFSRRESGFDCFGHFPFIWCTFFRRNRFSLFSFGWNEPFMSERGVRWLVYRTSSILTATRPTNPLKRPREPVYFLAHALEVL